MQIANNHRVKEARQIVGLTQKEFAEAIGITQAALSLIESGGGISTKVALSISEKFGFNLNWIVTGYGTNRGDKLYRKITGFGNKDINVRIAHRIIPEIKKRLSIDTSEFCKLIGVDITEYHAWKQSEKYVPGEVILKLYSEFNVSEKYLLLQQGAIFSEEELKKEIVVSAPIEKRVKALEEQMRLVMNKVGIKSETPSEADQVTKELRKQLLKPKDWKTP